MSIKVAVCLSGALRSFKEIYPSLYKNIIEPFNADIFMHCWVRDKKFNKHNRVCGFKWIKDKTKVDEAIQLANPKKYIFEKFNENVFKELLNKYELNDCLNTFKINDDDNEEIKKRKNKQRKYFSNGIGMYHKIFMVNELKKEYEKENGFTYNIVIRCRPDFMYESYLKRESLDIILNHNSPNNVILKALDRYATAAKSNDKFSIGTSELMNKYCELILHFKKYYLFLKSKNKIVEGQLLDNTHCQNMNFELLWFHFLYERNDRPGKTKITEYHKKRYKYDPISNQVLNIKGYKHNLIINSNH